MSTTATSSAAGTSAASGNPSPTLDSEDDMELRFLNHCLSNAVQVHFLVTSSFTDESWQSSSLLEVDSQQYMQALLSKYAASAVLRARLISGDSLYYLQCLTDEQTRGDFVQVAAAPIFPFASAA
ncbi:hypothetical protein N2W54_008123 [Lotmaria passim]